MEFSGIDRPASERMPDVALKLTVGVLLDPIKSKFSIVSN
jgi:hypothetical protein